MFCVKNLEETRKEKNFWCSLKKKYIIKISEKCVLTKNIRKNIRTNKKSRLISF